MDTLSELEERLSILTEIRNTKVATARAMMQRANAEYDREALPLHRQIERLRNIVAQPAPALPRPKVSRPPKPLPEPDSDWSAAEQEHFRQLQGR